MLSHIKLDPSFALHEEFADTSREPTILLNVFDVDPADHEPFKGAWVVDAEFFQDQPGCISSQLHQGLGSSRTFLNYAVFEETAAFAGTTRQPQVEPLRRIYPDSAVAHPHLFRRLAVPDVCTGDEGWTSPGGSARTPRVGLRTEDLDPSTPLAAQLDDPTGKGPTIQVTLFDVDRADRDALVDAWRTSALALAARPGCLTQQLHVGLLDSRMLMAYAVWESTAALADALAAVDVAALDARYPDGARARAHLFRRLRVPGICVGETDGREAIAAGARMMPVG